MKIKDIKIISKILATKNGNFKIEPDKVISRVSRAYSIVYRPNEKIVEHPLYIRNISTFINTIKGIENCEIEVKNGFINIKDNNLNVKWSFQSSDPELFDEDVKKENTVMKMIDVANDIIADDKNFVKFELTPDETDLIINNTSQIKGKTGNTVNSPYIKVTRNKGSRKIKLFLGCKGTQDNMEIEKTLTDIKFDDEFECAIRASAIHKGKWCGYIFKPDFHEDRGNGQTIPYFKIGDKKQIAVYIYMNNVEDDLDLIAIHLQKL